MKPVIKPGIIARLNARIPDLSLEDLIEERTGEDPGKVVYAAGRYAITERKKKYTVLYVTGDDAVSEGSFTVYKDALNRVTELIAN